jgi:2',3'-cyclic-nucleotide 2'-phosphodiesterase (5'-nucleotidase family)
MQTVGNHEFDFGSDALGNYVKDLQHPALGACNLDFKGHWLKDYMKNYITKTVKGKKVSWEASYLPHPVQQA